MAPGTDGERLADCGIDLIRSCLSQYGYEMKIQPSKDLQDPERSINLTVRRRYRRSKGKAV